LAVTIERSKLLLESQPRKLFQILLDPNIDAVPGMVLGVILRTSPLELVLLRTSLLELVLLRTSLLVLTRGVQAMVFRPPWALHPRRSRQARQLQRRTSARPCQHRLTSSSRLAHTGGLSRLVEASDRVRYERPSTI
jgi:hypothetical protein